MCCMFYNRQKRGHIMFCKNCGKEIEDGCAFCMHCGSQTENAPEKSSDFMPKAVPAFLAAFMAKVTAIHKKSKWILPACGVGFVAVIIAIILLAGGAGDAFSMTDYLKIEITGYNSYSHFDYNFDKESLAAYILGCGECKTNGDFDKLSNEVKEKYLDKFESDPVAYAFYSSLKVNHYFPDVKYETDLQNGDKITFVLSCDEEAAKQLGVEVKGCTFQYTIKELKTPETFDLMPYFEPVYEGADGFAYATVRCKTTQVFEFENISFDLREDRDFFTAIYRDGDYTWRYDFYPYIDYNQNGSISNGDTITLSLGFSTADNFIQHGILLPAAKTAITVTGLTEPDEFDVFEYIKVTFTGISGSGLVNVQYKQEEARFGDFRIDFISENIYLNDEYVSNFNLYWRNGDLLKNGDSFYLEVDCVEESMANKGIKFKESLKEYTVNGLAEYVTELNQLDNTLFRFQEASVTVIKRELRSNWGYAVHNDYLRLYTDTVIGDDFTHHKTILTTNKDPYEKDDNRLYLIYTVTLDDDAITTPTLYYFATIQHAVAYNADADHLGKEISLSVTRGFTSYDDLYAHIFNATDRNIEVSQ